MKIIHSACARPSALSPVLRLLLLREACRLVLPDNRDRSIGVDRAARDRHILGVGQRRMYAKHGVARPLDQARPHFADEYQR
jgi:hypothetical protein